MKHSRLHFIIQRTSLLFFIAFLFLQQLTAQQQAKEFTLDDIYTSGKFFPKSIRGLQWINGGKAFSYLETDTAKKQTDIWKYDAATGMRTKFVDASKLVL